MPSQAIFQYDPSGRLSTVNFDNGSQITYQYDAAGNRTSVVQVSGLLADEQMGDLLFNGAFRFFQRQGPTTLTSRANGSYGPDRWYMLGNSGATDIQCAQVVADSVQGHACQVKNNNAAAKFTGMAQIIPFSDTLALRGQQLIFQGVAKTSAAGRNMRAAILEWTGAADAVAFGGTVGRDPVLNWASTNYTAGNFFRNTSLVVTAVSASFTPGTAYTQFSVTGTVSASAKNLVLVIWEETATPAAATWSLSKAGLFRDTAVQLWVPPSFGVDYARCAPFFQKSYALDVAPGTANGAGGERFQTSTAIATAVAGNLRYGVRLGIVAYKTPAFALYALSTGAIDSVQNETASTVRGSATAANIATSGFRQIAIGTSANAIALDATLAFHWTMDAEL